LSSLAFSIVITKQLLRVHLVFMNRVFWNLVSKPIHLGHLACVHGLKGLAFAQTRNGPGYGLLNQGSRQFNGFFRKPRLKGTCGWRVG
jgi:hypothetical protein